MVCFVPGHDGESHIDKKMIVPVEVVPGGEQVAEPTAEGEIVLEDYAIDLPKGFDGKGTFAVRNAGPADHELILMRFKDGKDPGRPRRLVRRRARRASRRSPTTSGVGTIPRGRDELGRSRPRARARTSPSARSPDRPASRTRLMGMTAQFEIG